MRLIEPADTHDPGDIRTRTATPAPPAPLRSILVLPAFVILALLLTVVYALLGIRGPETVLREARRALDGNDFQRSIDLLTSVEAALPNDRTGLLEQTLRMRIKAYQGLGLRERVLADAGTLFDTLGIRDHALMCVRIRMHNEIAAESGDREVRQSGWDLAQAWLAEHGDDAAVLAEAGIARDLEAAAARERWLDSLASTIPRRDHPALRALMDRATHCVAGPRVQATRLLRLAAEIDAQAPGSSDNALRTAAEIRQIVLQARGFHQRSLACRKITLRGYAGLAAHLRASGDDDTLLMVAHSFLHRAGPRSGLAAAVDIADVHLRHHRYRAADRAVDRVLPLGSLRQRYLAGTLDHHAIRLIVCRAIALRRMTEPEQIRRLCTDFIELLDQENPKVVADLELHPWQHFIFGLLLATNDARRAHLSAFLYGGNLKKTEWNRRLVLDVACRALAQECRDSERERVLEHWMRSVPLSVEPVHALARFRTGHGKAGLAVPMLRQAMRTLPRKDETLALLVDAELAAFAGDLDGAIQHAQRFESGVPDEIGQHSALTIPAARRALELGAFAVARECAARALRLFPGTAAPVHLVAEAHLRDRNPARALPIVEEHLRHHPGDRRALALQWQARVAAGRPTDDLHFAALPYGDPTLESARFLARKWLARGEHQRVLRLAERAMQRFGADLELEILATKALIMDPDSDRRQVLIALRTIYETSGASLAGPPPAHMLWALSQFILRNPAMVGDDLRAGMLDRFLAANRSGADLDALAAGLAEAGALELALRAYRDLTIKEQYTDYRRGAHFVAAGRLALRLGTEAQAEGFFHAALAFADGKDAALHLTLVDRLRSDGRGGDRPGAGGDVDSVRAAALAPDRTRAAGFLRALLEGNPDHLAAQCVLATLDPDAAVAASVRQTATRVGDELAFVTALLEDGSYATPALRRLTKLRAAHPDDPVLLVLSAKAHTYRRDFTAVERMLEAVGKRLLTDIPLAAETLAFLVASDHPVIRNSKLMDHLAALLLKMGSSAPPALMATLVRHNADVLRMPQIRTAVVPLLAEFWLRHAKLAGVGLREAQILIDSGHHTAALRLLKLIEGDLPAADRGRFLDVYFRNAETLAQQVTPAARIEIVKEAIRILNGEVAHGAPLHFVLNVLDADFAHHESTAAGQAVFQRVRAMERDFLLRHIDAFAAGQDDSIDNLTRTLERLRDLRGPEVGLQRLDDVLRRDPSLVRLWRLRADWLTQMDRVEEAITSLLWLPHYLDSVDVIDTVIDLMNRAGVLIERGAEYLARESLARASRYSIGLAQLRFGAYLQGAQAMALPRPRPDGSDLYYRAVALLALQTTAAVDEARSLLRQLVHAFPESNYALPSELVLQVL